MAEDQDRQINAALAQLHRLVETGDGQIVRARVLQQRGDLHRAVPVSVGLDHAQKAAALGQTAADRLIIVPQRAERDLRPGPFSQIVHSDAPLIA